MVIGFYILALVMSFFIFGSLAENLKLHKKIREKQLNVGIVTISILVYLVFVFLVLNNWAIDLLNL